MSVPCSKHRAITWTLLTAIAPLTVSLFAANVYVYWWYAHMEAMGTPHDGAPPLPVVLRGVMLTAGVGLWFTVLLWWYLWRQEASFSALFQARTQGAAFDITMGLLLGAFWVAVYGVVAWPPFSAMFVFDRAKLESLPTSLSAGLCEEFLFRGFVVLLLSRAGSGVKGQIAFSSLAFGLAHIAWGPVGMLFTVALGTSFAGISHWRGSVWPAVIAHTLLDICIEPAMMEKAMAFNP